MSNHIINLPNNPERIEQLRRKLAEYKSRINEHVHPELQMDAICKVFVLENLIKQRSVDTFDLSQQMYEKYGRSFSASEFNSACGVIKDYCETGGKNVSEGTGLPA